MAIAPVVKSLSDITPHYIGDNRTVRLAELVRSADVQVHLIKDGDHRLSRDSDIALLIQAIEDVTPAL